MISLEEVERTIIELEQKDTSFVNCERLAWLYIVRTELRQYNIQKDEKLSLQGKSEIVRASNGKNTEEVWKVIDEMADTIKILHPKMYEKIIEKLNNL